MELFKKVKATPAMASAPVAAASGAPQPGHFIGYSVGAAEDAALSVPTVSRAISLLSTVVATLNLKSYTLQWTGQEYEELYVEGESWMTRPDPKITRNFIMSKTARDLILYGRAFWMVTSRYSTGYPATFQWLPGQPVRHAEQRAAGMVRARRQGQLQRHPPGHFPAGAVSVGFAGDHLLRAPGNSDCAEA
jgi:phage portal protein BeeE